MPPPIPGAEVPELPDVVRQTQDARRIPDALLPDQQIPAVHPVRQDLPVSCASDASASALPEAAEGVVHPGPADEAAQR